MRLQLVSVALVLVGWTGCSLNRSNSHQIAGGDSGRGKHLAAWYGCGSCHRIPGLNKAVGLVAPSLDRVGRRSYIAGIVPNTPENLVRWIRAPRNVDARTIMPDMNIPEQDARDLAAFLHTLH